MLLKKILEGENLEYDICFPVTYPSYKGWAGVTCEMTEQGLGLLTNITSQY